MKDYNKKEILEIAKQHFPFSTPNPGQLEAIVDAVYAILDGKKHVVIDAPTGSGKSIIATTIHRTLKSIRKQWVTTIITATKGLQNQYMKDDPQIVDLRAKANYSCPMGVGPYLSGGCIGKVSSGKCQADKSCPYVKQRTRWQKYSEIRLTNFSFQIECPPEMCADEDNAANLIIVDECHEIDEKIIDHTTIEIEVERYMVVRQFGFEDFVSLVSKYVKLFEKMEVGETFQITDAMYDGMLEINRSADTIIENLESQLETTTDHSRIALIGSVIERVTELTNSASIFEACDQRNGTWILNMYALGKMEIKPVYSWQVAHHALLRKAPQFVHMTATLCGLEEYLGELGIENMDDVEYIQIDNHIPLKNRRVNVIPTQKVSQNFDIHKLVNDIDMLIDMNSGKNGIIHTVSFKLANEIMEKSKHKKNMLVSGDQDEIKSFLGTVSRGRIVLSPSIEKGFDAKGDMSRFQIIAKVPFAYLGSPIVSLNAKIRPRWYLRRCILRLVQACGRSIRGVDDYAKTYIIDANFLRVVRDGHEIMPEWFVDSLNIVE